VTEKEIRAHLRESKEQREQAKKRAEETRAELKRFVGIAREAGLPISLIASEAGLSRQGVYDLLGERPSS
jgi:outer membrane protein TolC